MLVVTGLQKFDGEDLNNKARTKYQQEQLREWSEKQKKEREQAEANQVLSPHRVIYRHVKQHP